MLSSTKFWISMLVFQIVFGLAIFAITRHYYISDPVSVTANPAVAGQSLPVWPDQVTEADLSQFSSSSSAGSTSKDPVAISRQADEFFAGKQYDRAADLYEQLLVFDPNNVDTYNNLGLTLHYLGRSSEALARLNEGVAVNPTHQRIWLTLGFVNSQLGNIEQARTALTTAAQIDADNEVGQSAVRMLENLP